MRRVLVPLDGTEEAASILPDARRLAGPAGTLILMRDTHHSSRDLTDRGSDQLASIEGHLHEVAGALRREGIAVEIHPMTLGDAAVAIDEAAELFQADMIALATHGESAAEHWQRGSIAWRALLRSTVPVLIRHSGGTSTAFGLEQPEKRRLLVPLDGSDLAEIALTLAERLAAEWDASLWLLHVVADREEGDDRITGEEEAAAYLEHIAQDLTGDIHTQVRTGPVVESVIDGVRTLGITDIVMTTHGRTGLSRVLVGTVANELIHQLHCPIVVIPALAALSS